MVNSMTGFGRGEAEGDGFYFSVEIKAVNHRFLEISVKQPRSFLMFEELIRKKVQERLQRGRIEIYINIKEIEERQRIVKVDKELSLAYDNSLRELAKELKIGYITDVFQLISLPEVLSLEEEEIEEELLFPVLEKALDKALNELVFMREREGERLKKDLEEKIQNLKRLTGEIRARAPQISVEYRERLQERLADLLSDTTLDESRLAMEVALLADKASVDEELVRLESHLEEFGVILASTEPIGRRLDFLVQEMNREINTIGSKANDLTITRQVLESKSELEKIREQIQNIE